MKQPSLIPNLTLSIFFLFFIVALPLSLKNKTDQSVNKDGTKPLLLRVFRKTPNWFNIIFFAYFVGGPLGLMAYWGLDKRIARAFVWFWLPLIFILIIVMVVVGVSEVLDPWKKITFIVIPLLISKKRPAWYSTTE